MNLSSKQWRFILHTTVVSTVVSTVLAFILWGVAIVTDSGTCGGLGALAAGWAIVSGIAWGCTYDMPGKAEAVERAEQRRLDEDELRALRQKMYERTRSVHELVRLLKPISPDASEMVREWWANGGMS